MGTLICMPTWWVAPTIRWFLSFLWLQCALFSGALVHCSLKTTLKTLLEKSVIYEWIEAKRAANQSVWDINIPVGDEKVAAVTQRSQADRKGKVMSAIANWKLREFCILQRLKATVCDNPSESCLVSSSHMQKASSLLPPAHLSPKYAQVRVKWSNWVAAKKKQKKKQSKKQTKHSPRKTSITYFFGTLRPSLVEAEPYDAEIFAVEDELCWVELQFLVWTQYFSFPLCIIYWGKTNANYDLTSFILAGGHVTDEW